MTLDEEVQAAADNRDLEGLLALLGARPDSSRPQGLQQLGRVLEGSGALKGQGLEGAGQLVTMLQQGYDLEEALKGQLAEAEQQVGAGASAGSRRAALFLATQLREELGQLMRSHRVLRRLLATAALQPGSSRAEGAAEPPPPTSHTPTGRLGAAGGVPFVLLGAPSLQAW
ncbi:hypothetical protein HaLaN_05035 [Haematococcus lacustris]|uniref:Uncharacterized protein n=1 Tax=Haematococcus lacustris TaxID=44745 RepID=A0A699YI00_HAELA|nr:hypothetical protein HaLaN_05035 [Haematococcus lacustris]